MPEGRTWASGSVMERAEERRGRALVAATIGLAVTVALEVGVLRLVVGPRFAAMFADFGAAETIPWLARQMTSGVLIYGVVLLVALAAAAGSFSGWRTRRRDWVTGGFAAALVCALALPAVFLFGLYLPVFELADAVAAP